MSHETFSERWPESAPGKFYVDQQCLDCDLCRQTAPEFFYRNDAGGYSYIHKQPTSKVEIELVTEAIEGCPCEAIFSDGDQFDWTQMTGKKEIDSAERSERIRNKRCPHCNEMKRQWWKFWK